MHQIMYEIKAVTGKAQHELAADIGTSRVQMSHFFHGISVSQNTLTKLVKLPYLTEHLRALLIQHYIMETGRLPTFWMTHTHFEKVANKVSKRVAATLSKPL